MAEFRRNHSLFDSGPIIKVLFIAILLGGLYYLFNSFLSADIAVGNENYETGEDAYIEREKGKDYYLPTSNTGQIVKHQYYTLSYSEEHEQPEWVAYEMTKAQRQGQKVRRKDNFRPDTKVKTKSAARSDYKRSGYDRGHLVPAGDMNFNEQAMSESFYMSNMSPQVRNFNGGIWRELEEQTRDWVYKYKHLYVVSGPVLTVRPIERIGRNKVSVPRSYYKVLLDITKPEMKGIGFIMDNEVSDRHLSEYAVTIDEVESLTGIDFFPDLLSPDQERQLEGNVEIDRWTFNEKRYKQRVKSWNKR